MNRHMQNAYSEQGSLEVERQIGPNNTLSVGYQHVRGLHLIISVNRNVPMCVASGNNNGRRPNPGFGNNSPYSPLVDSHYDGLHISFAQRPSRWGNYRLSYTYSKTLDNVGGFFFSSPIDNFNIWQDYGRSDDDQRHRLVFDGTIHSPTGTANTTWQKISHGFRLGGMLQYYSALPFNITAGTNTLRGSRGAPNCQRDIYQSQRWKRFRFLQPNARLSRSFQATEHVRLEGTFEAFNSLHHVNGVALNGTFGTGVYPANPLPTFKQVTAVADPRNLQLGLRVSI
jgi:hypothetical protein